MCVSYTMWWQNQYPNFFLSVLLLNHEYHKISIIHEHWTGISLNINVWMRVCVYCHYINIYCWMHHKLFTRLSLSLWEWKVFSTLLGWTIKCEQYILVIHTVLWDWLNWIFEFVNCHVYFVPYRAQKNRSQTVSLNVDGYVCCGIDLEIIFHWNRIEWI